MYKILIIIVLIHTDLPEPVAPAIRRCGILAISATLTFPAISFPTANAIFDRALLNSSDSTSSLNDTATLCLFGTSIPTAAFPGIGASILMSAAARLSFMSSARFTILLTFTPISGVISNLVTAGPQLILFTFAFTPKTLSVCSSFAAVSISSACVFPVLPPFAFARRSTVGNS